MSNEHTPTAGEDDRRTASELATDTESETADQRGGQTDDRIEAIIDQNQRLRERINHLEAELGEIKAESSTETTAAPSDGTPILVTGGGQVCKVIGELTDAGGIGVYGHNKASAGTGQGVKGETDSSDDGTTGVTGLAAASGTTGQTYGVEGISNANASFINGTNPAGVAGEATGSGSVYGVYGRGAGTGGYGLVGDTTKNGDYTAGGGPTGVLGVTDRSGADDDVVVGVGVEGDARATEGQAYGVYGNAKSSNPDSYAVFAGGDTKTTGDHEVGGQLSVDNVGASVYLSSDQTISPNSYETVAFDSENFDDKSEFDTGTSEFSPSADGIYHVSGAVEWIIPETGRALTVSIRVNSSRVAAQTISSSGGNMGQTISKSLKLTTSDSVTLAVYKPDNDGTSEELRGDDDNTYATFVRLG